MAYYPSLSDLDDDKYTPSLSDLDKSTSVTDNLSSQAQNSGGPKRSFTDWPDITKPEVIQALNKQRNEQAKSLINDAVGMGEGSIAEPAINVGKGLFAKYIANPLLNLGSRVGKNTASSLALQNNGDENLNDIGNKLKSDLVTNSLLEIPTLGFRIPAYFAEMFNPEKYAAEKESQIAKETAATKAVTNEMYNPVNLKYNNQNVTDNGSKLLNSLGIERSDLWPDAKIIHDKFIKEPTFKNLHDLQSKLGSDWARASKSVSSEEKAQLFNNHRESIKNSIQEFLSKDPKSQEQYNAASEYAKNNYYPYKATPTLSEIGEGEGGKTPTALAKSISQATKKKVGSGEEKRYIVPQQHPLRNHLNDINKFNHFANAMKFGLPVSAGAIAGNYLYPGYGAGLGGLGLASLIGMASRTGLTQGAHDFIQNPLIQNVFGSTVKPYYATGRAVIGNSNKKE